MAASTIESNTFVEKLHADGIIPDVLTTSTFSPPGYKLEIVYPDVRVQAGEILERPQAATAPVVELATTEDPGTLYTIIMVDPDLMKKNDTLSGQVRHWLQPGVRFDPLSHQATYTEPAITNYLPSTPALGTGNHRYVFIVARQSTPASVQVNEALVGGGQDADLKSRIGFNAEQYMKEAGLQPVAVAWMFVKPDLVATVADAQAMAQSAINKLRGK